MCHFDDEVILFGVKKSVNVSAKQNSFILAIKIDI